MHKIPLKQYAETHGKDPSCARKLAGSGGFATAEKIGRDWFIDPSESWPDRRVKSGKYVGWRQKHKEDKK